MFTEFLLEDLDRTNIQCKTTKLDEVAKSIGLNINKKKTKVKTVNDNSTQSITVSNNNIEEVIDFTYLVSVISNNSGTANDMKTRISKARSAVCQLQSIWKSESI